MTKLTFTLLAACLIMKTAISAPSDSTVLLYNTVDLFNGTTHIQKGQNIYIAQPSHQPLAGVHSYEHIYVSRGENIEQNPKLVGHPNFISKILALISGKTRDKYYAMIKEPKADKTLFIDLSNAILDGEIELPGSNLLNSHDLFMAYLKTKDSISDVDIDNYIFSFYNQNKGQNEFEQQKFSAAIRDSLLRYKNSQSLCLKNLHFITEGTLGEYDFAKHAFPLLGLPRQKLYPIKLSETISAVGIEFTNLEDEILIPMPENTAEELTKQLNHPKRNVYCIYSFDYLDNDTILIKTGGISPSLSKAFVKTARLTKIDIFKDATFSDKITTINL